MRHYGRLRQRSVIRPYPSTALAGGPPPLGRGGFVPGYHSGLHRTRRQCTLVGAATGRPRQGPSNKTRRCKFVPGWVCEYASACCIFFVFTADGQWPPLHTGMCPALLVCSYGCTYVRNFSETPIRFFLRLSAILQLSGIPCKSPNKTRKPKHSEPRVIQKG